MAVKRKQHAGRAPADATGSNRWPAGYANEVAGSASAMATSADQHKAPGE
ncbi:hypothetical protein OG937_23710 [Streptomyces sp. NBC_00510]